MGSRRRAQSPSSVNKTSQWQLACVFRHAHSAPRCGYKRRARANAHQLFASEPSHCKSPECSQDESHRRALVLRHVNGGRCPVLLFLCGHAATSPRRFSAPKRDISKKKKKKREQSKRAPRATGVFLKMASRSCVSGCGRFLTPSDGHDRCPSCLGFRHAEAALVDESCSHCGNTTMAMLHSRYLLARRGGIPLALPRFETWMLGHVLVPPDGGLLRLRARVIWGSQWELPRRVRLRGPLTPRAHRTVWGSRMSMRGPRTGQGPASHSVPQQMTGYRSLHRGMS